MASPAEEPQLSADELRLIQLVRTASAAPSARSEALAFLESLLPQGDTGWKASKLAVAVVLGLVSGVLVRLVSALGWIEGVPYERIVGLLDRKSTRLNSSHT